MGDAKRIAKRIVASGCEGPDHDDSRAMDWDSLDSPDMSVGPDSLEQCSRCKLELCETCRRDHTC